MYAFVSPDKPDTVTLIANYIPLQEPSAGPNFFSFGDDVLYEIKIDNDGSAEPRVTYQFRFTTQVQNPNTFLYNTGPVSGLSDANLNVRQTYTVTRVTSSGKTVLGSGIPVAPANVGVKSFPNYDAVANQAIRDLGNGVTVFAGPRTDPFFADVASLFDLLTIRKLPGNQGGGFNVLQGKNVHTIAIQVPKTHLTRDGAAPTDPRGANAVIGVWATASRQKMQAIRRHGQSVQDSGDWVQVSRLGMPLVNEVVVPLGAKDLFNNSQPRDDAQFLAGVTDPEPARLLHALYNIDVPPTPRNDLVAVFLTGVAGLNQPPNVKPAEELRLNMAIPPSKDNNGQGNRLGVIGGDLAGFPNGRRLNDDVVDIELRALAGVLVEGFKDKTPNNQLGDGVDGPASAPLATYPYVASPIPGDNAVPTS